MFESNLYARVGVAMIEELYRTVSEKAEAAEHEAVQPRRTWRHRLARLVVNLCAGREATRPCPDDCDQPEIGCI
ncbi:MAG: hypothetical protein HND44_16435 [Chloroflexi bacterium]|nr:hypothetical protein [Ardenticatenaceae bacterium]MBL1130046.1 hypothetical protein [Chloroflexota bacterium]NOG36133.1 hypothetical protein [Chloroflexota bacterium]GIK57848.1 MAG: hypothetical protein BroJett015_35110 [Chloroflexota bacterium]